MKNCTKCSYPDNSWKFIFDASGVNTIGHPARKTSEKGWNVSSTDVCRKDAQTADLKFIDIIPPWEKKNRSPEKNIQVISSKESNSLESYHSNFCFYSFFQMFIFVGAELFNFLYRISAASNEFKAEDYSTIFNMHDRDLEKKRSLHKTVEGFPVFT